MSALDFSNWAKMAVFAQKFGQYFLPMPKKLGIGKKGY